MNYVDVRRLLTQSFDKQTHEEKADYLISELAVREKRMEGILQPKRHKYDTDIAI